MTRYELIKSYAHAEGLGLKPNDSIVNKVIDTSKKEAPYHVVGYVGSGDHQTGQVTFDHRIKHYEAFAYGDDEPYSVHAVSPRVARMLVNEALRKGTKYELYNLSTRRKHLAEA